MDKSDEFLTINEALAILASITAEQLRVLVNSKLLPAFRDGDAMKFRRSDIEQVAARISATGKDKDKELIALLNRTNWLVRDWMRSPDRAPEAAPAGGLKWADEPSTAKPTPPPKDRF